MEIAQKTGFETAQTDVRSHDVTIMLGHTAFAILLLIAIYFGSMSSGTAPGDFATMTVFPWCFQHPREWPTRGDYIDMSRGSHFRKWAAQVARQAGEEPDPNEAQRLLGVAEHWVRLADCEEREPNQSAADPPQIDS
jgi:hypothetical protein